MAAAEQAGVPYLVGGRDEGALRAVAGPGCVGLRVTTLETLAAALAGVGAVVSTVGPFARLGLPVLDAALAAGVPYVDSCAEQPFVEVARSREGAAVAAGVAALPSCGVEYLPMCVGAALLGPGPVDTWLWLDDFVPTRGSVRSMVAVAGSGPTPVPRRVTTEDRTGYAITIQGAEAVLVHPDSRTHLVLARWVEGKAFELLWPVARWVDVAALGDRLASALRDPTPAQRARARFTVVVAQGERALRMDGMDVYASTGQFLVAVGAMLARGEARGAGVRSVGEVFDPDQVLREVGLSARSCPRPR